MEGLRKFRSWIASSSIKIRVETDHQGLQFWYNEDLNKMTGAVGRRGRWHEFLSQFCLEIVYVKGGHKVADPLSRWTYPPALEDGDATFHGTLEAEMFQKGVIGCNMCMTPFPLTLTNPLWVSPFSSLLAGY